MATAKMRVFAKYALFFITALLVLAADQTSKAWITAHFALHASRPLVPGCLSISHIRNPGAAFGFLAAASPGFRSVFFLAVTAVAILLIVYYLARTKRQEKLLVFSLALILAGAVGNLVDRIRFGEVIDFLDVYVGTHHWPAFNCADAAISCGAVLLFLQLVRDRKAARHPA